MTVPSEKPLRLDRYIANVTDLTRKEARQAIKQGLVIVDGETCLQPASHILPSADVSLDGLPLRPPLTRYFMLNKPPGFVCVNKDRRHPSVLELLEVDSLGDLHPAGRLDLDTTGLVFITDDGPWAHRVTSPNTGCDKTYLVETALTIDPACVDRFARGLMLPGDKKRLQPAHLELLANHRGRLTIREGRYHQVKRMFQLMGNTVVALHRERVGAVVLDPELAAGEYRALTEAEVASFGQA
jgi:16S rRNA pseudouridine516 synthase